jgi:sterol desaturase/sphingolipid hydroxylase (fatty acid hydroxylase superfamily)
VTWTSAGGFPFLLSALARWLEPLLPFAMPDLLLQTQRLVDGDPPLEVLLSLPAAMVLEYLLALQLGKADDWFSATDTLAAIGSGILNQTFGAVCNFSLLVAYSFLHNRFALFSDQVWWVSPLGWLCAFLIVDLGYYVWHRCAHSTKLFWAIHEVHHSSNCFNLTVNLRQSALAGFDGFVIYLPLAPVIPLEVVSAHQAFNLLFQFVLHTRLVGKLSEPIEFLFNTPSHHRVHHSRVPECIDKNFGGVLIVWDRVFGTFAPEPHAKDASSLVEPYGTIPPHTGSDPLAHQSRFALSCVRGVPWSQSFAAWLRPPADVWREGGWKRLGKIPPLGTDQNPRERVVAGGGAVPSGRLAVAALFAAAGLVEAVAFQDVPTLPLWEMIAKLAIAGWCCSCIGRVLDHRPLPLRGLGSWVAVGMHMMRGDPWFYAGGHLVSAVASHVMV